MPSNSKHAHNKARITHNTHKTQTEACIRRYIETHTHTHTHRCSWWMSSMEGSKVGQCQLNGVTTGEWFLISHKEAKTNIFILSFCYPRDKVRMPSGGFYWGEGSEDRGIQCGESSLGRGYLSLHLRSFALPWRPSQLDLMESSPNFLSVSLSMEQELQRIFTHMF